MNLKAMKRPRLILISAVTAALLLSGCTSNAPEATSEEIDALFSSKEQQKEIAGCLNEAGWDSTFDNDSGSFTTSVPEEQEDQYEADYETCAEEAGVDFSGTLTEKQFAAAYSWYEMIGECLNDHGYSVPTQPSFETFKSTYETDPWLPWIEVPAEQMNKAREDCPELSRPQS